MTDPVTDPVTSLPATPHDRAGDGQAPQAQRTLRDIVASLGAGLPTDDVLHLMVGLMGQVAALHEQGRVARIDLDQVQEAADGRLELVDPAGVPPRLAQARLDRIQPRTASALKIVGEYRVTTDEDEGTSVETLTTADSPVETITKPVYLPELRNWEAALGHHDEITDVFTVGMILAALACGLDLADSAAIQQFDMNRSNLFAIAPRLHPVLASIILEATTLNRHDRATSLAELKRRLETYRDQPVALDLERVLAQASSTGSRRSAVLSHLRDRLFDLSRRNRLIHFRATQSSVNLTEASVPMVVRLESVRADTLCTWKGRFISDVLSGSNVPLNQWLRFEDQPQLPSTFHRIIQETRRDRSEYGFSNLRLVVAFLHWHNLKEAPHERIVSPLLWLPAEVTKQKGVRDQYVMRCPESWAEFNPALRHMLRQLYAIELPEGVDLQKTSLAEIHANLVQQIQSSEPGVQLELQERPQIQLIHRKAVQRVARFNRRRGAVQATGSTKLDFSYDRDDYRPLGLALFERFVRPSPLPQRLAAGGGMEPSVSYAVAQAETKTYSLGGDAGHRFAWQLNLTEVTLANLNYRKMSLVRDYAELIDQPGQQPGFDRVFSIEPRPLDSHAPPPLPVAEQWGVVPADATQDAAVAMARTGRSFIIQGPPGTGKSQTITNLIADYAARGKRVLFVCEKRAALDVVFHRLGQAGLAGLACIIHDSQEDKKAFIADLKEHYERWGRAPDRLHEVLAVRSRSVAALEQHLAAIASYDAQAGAGTDADGRGLGLRALVRRAASLPPAPSGIGPQHRERLPSPAAFDAATNAAERAVRAVREAAGAGSLAAHPFARINRATILGEHPVSRVGAMVDQAEALIEQLDSWLDGGSLAVDGTVALDSAVAVGALAERFTATGLSRNLALLASASDSSVRLAAELARIARMDQQAAAAASAASNWRDPLSPADTAAALDVARNREGSWLKLFFKDWRDVNQAVRGRYDFAAHAVTPKVVAVLELLSARHEAEAACREARSALAATLQSDDLDGLLELRADLATGRLPSVAEQQLVRKVQEAARPHEALLEEARQLPVLRELKAVVADVLDGAEAMPIERLAELVRDLREALEDLPDILPVLAEVHAADPAVSFALRSLDLPLPQLAALITDEAVARLERQYPDLKRFDSERLIAVSRRALAARERLRVENAEAIKATLHRQFRDHVRVSEQSVTQLDADARAFKKTYATGRRELEHEFGKTMRYRSIRDLASGNPGAVVNDLKPIWLMSPLSVSDTLPLRPDLFDVVIFDEASQIPTEEAVPALCRSGQVIVVGDEMQLPPTSFFSTALEDEDRQVLAEEDGETIAIILDADSLLNQAARNLPATLLAWHYRSRYEALIGFSNAAFYDGRLVTIPDRALHPQAGGREPVRSDDVAGWSAGASRLLALPISTHKIADGCYEGRSNPPEARYIAGLVRELLSRETGSSIGIVAFSEAQQSEIETALDRLAAEEPGFAAALEREYVREDDGQFNGLFVKNLENVQGDERDIILLSICYAPGRDGRMVMNFGPINQRGGEKRLNVIFSRARQHMAIVTTIEPEAITNVHNDGARALRSFLSYAGALSGGAQEQAQAVLATLNPAAGEVFDRAAGLDPVRTALAEALRARGHTVHELVGGASFRCDLAIVNAAGDGYALAILLDRDASHTGDQGHGPGDGVEERFVFRPSILRAFGWRVIDVPVAGWLRARDTTVQRIEAELERSSWDLADDDPYAGVSLPVPAGTSAGFASPALPSRTQAQQTGAESTQTALPVLPEISATPAPAASPATGQGAITMTEFRFTEGNSSKFWRIGVSGCDMVVEYGRIGTQGQRMLKTFDTPERAAREAIKLTLEKTRKGYQEA